MTLGSLAVTTSAVADPSTQEGADASANTQVMQNTTDAAQAKNATEASNADAVDQQMDAAANSDDGISTAALSDRTVQGLTPKGINIDLFDYWITGETDNDRSGSWGWIDNKWGWNTKTITDDDRGINDGHVLKFNPSAYPLEGPVQGTNVWTNSSSPRTGIVANKLSGGYPQLSGTGENGESLSYLFNPNEASDGKRSYPDVKGLLQLDANGNYTYDSTQNFASYNKETNSFSLYDTWGVKADGSSDDGQFFPFNSASDVFEESNGRLTQQERASSNSPDMNHLFGLHMNATFIQPTGGVVSNGKPMVFDFSGDDDVWIFIDGVLVGDLGGIHNMSTLSIDFSNGKVTGNQTTSLQDAFRKAGVNLQGDTFKDGTYHTLDLFYLERGNSDSNLRLTTNLVPVPETDVVKVDQSGESLKGAEFALYATGADYSVKGDPLAKGETDSAGNLILKDSSDIAIDFGKRYSDDPSTGTHYVLQETKAPDGYSRMINPMHVTYIQSKDKKSGVLASDPDSSKTNSTIWTTGGVARGKELIAATTTFTTVGRSGMVNNPCSSTCTTNTAISESSNGMMFAVVLKRTGTGDIADQSSWRVISGDMVKGWTVSKEAASIQNIVDTYKSMQQSGVDQTFKLSSSGFYEANIDALPGYLNEYYFMSNNDSETKYTVAMYYTTDKYDMNESNTWRVNSDDFNRTFSSRFYIPNIKNELFVQKVDEDGNPLANAGFALYGKDQVDVTVDGKVTVKTDQKDKPAGGTVTTTDSWVKNDGSDDGDPATPMFKGTAMFAVKSTSQANTDGISGTPLTNGVYYLVETSAPSQQYIQTTDASKIVVTDDGIFADAGKKDDDIKVVRGVGQLVATMSTFGSTGSFNDTLRYVKSVSSLANDVALADNCADLANNECNVKLTDTKATDLFTANVSDGKLNVSSDKAGSLELTYGGSGAALQYGPRTSGGNYVFVSDEGWPIMRTYQDNDYRNGLPENQREPEYTPLDGTSLSSIITGSALVQVTNEREGVALAAGSIKVSKTVKGAAAPSDFSFTLTPDATAAADIVGGLTNGKAQVAIKQSDLNDGVAQEAQFGELKFKAPVNTSATPEYTFTVTEDDASSSPAGWKYDQSAYTVTVQLKYDTTASTWGASVTSVKQTTDLNGVAIAAGQQTDVVDKVAAFTNQYVAVSSLPLTGGPSSMSYTWLALCIAGVGVLSWLSVNRWRNRHMVQ